MSFRLDQNDAFHDSPFYNDREEARTTPGPQEPRRGSKADAIERGFDPRDAIEDMQ